MSNSKTSAKSRLTGCFGKCALSGQKTRPKKIPSRHRSIQRLSFSDVSNSEILSPEDLSISLVGSNLYVFSIMELQKITQGFSMSNFLGEGGFGPVYKGVVDEKFKPGLKAQPVAVKLLDLDGAQGHKEWLAEVIYLGQLRHQHLVKLIGYCYEEEHRLLVYEFMARGSLERHLFRKYFATLPWLTRLKIALGAAKGLAFLHESQQRIIFRDFKTSNILLDSDFEAKLSDFGLAKDGPDGDETHISTRVMGTHGYAAPEYIMTGHLTTKSDVYSFGVVLLELLTGRRSVDKTRPTREQNLVEWARSSLNNPQKLSRFMDPSLDGQYSTKGAQKAATLAYQCLSQNPKSRPDMSVVVDRLEPLLAFDDIPPGSFVYTVESQEDKENDKKKDNESDKEKEGEIRNESESDNIEGSDKNEKDKNENENDKEKEITNESESDNNQNGNQSENDHENEKCHGDGSNNNNENENENENVRIKESRKGHRHKMKNGFGNKEVGKWIFKSYQKSEKTERDA